MAVERKELDWGVRLTVRPFTRANASLTIKAEIAIHKPGKGSEVRITFPGTSLAEPAAVAGRPGMERGHGRHHQGDSWRRGRNEGRGDEG